MFRTACLALAASCVVAATPAMASETISREVYVSGLSSPLDFVQNTVFDNIQYVVQQNGAIRVIEDGSLVPTAFLNISSRLSTGSERGLLGMALDPDFANNGRFYLNYTTNGANFGDTHIARYTLDTTARGGFDHLVGDFASEEVLMVINQDFSNHNGGCIRTGPDGMLYVALGDGGSGGDPNNRAQTRSQLLGSILRLDINTATGYNIPADNPYAGHPTFQEEIWSYGVRNTWRFTFDDFSPCASDGMIMGDVGQNAREEVNYEPAGEGGRNYGWRCREGIGAFNGCAPPAGESFTDPIFDYAQSAFGRSITGGYIYRGTEMAHNRGRYYFADFVSGRVASFLVTFDVDGEASASDYIEHTAELGGVGNVSAFGRDANGELYILSFNGAIYRVNGSVALGDVNQSNAIDSADLAVLLAAWGSGDCSVADLNNDGIVNSADLAVMLAGWGATG